MKVIINYTNVITSLFNKGFDIDFHYQGGYRWNTLIEKI